MCTEYTVTKCQGRLVSDYGLLTEIQGNPDSLEYGKKLEKACVWHKGNFPGVCTL